MVEDTSYKAWEKIDYKPAVKSFFPDELIKHLKPNSKILDVGCDKGNVCLALAEKGFNLTGLDISLNSIKHAKKIAKDKNLKIKFIASDFLKSEIKEKFDAISLIRVLTCIPDINDWENSLKKLFKMLPKKGLLYVRDFVYYPESYGERYEEGISKGLRKGSFNVYNKDGSLNFIAHHHSEEEIDRIKKDYEIVYYKEHESLSMNGNPVKMFEFIGMKK